MITVIFEMGGRPHQVGSLEKIELCDENTCIELFSKDVVMMLNGAIELGLNYRRTKDGLASITIPVENLTDIWY